MLYIYSKGYKSTDDFIGIIAVGENPLNKAHAMHSSSV